MKRISNSHAFSLTEILVVLGIILLLAAILLPVLANAKRQAKATDNASRLHQLGLAAALYHEQFGVWPWSTIDLVNQGLVPVDICTLLNDPTPNGIANAVAAEREMVRPFPPNKLQAVYRNGVVGLREFRVNQGAFENWISHAPAGGWALDMTSAIHPRQNWEFAEGRYKRLCFDGSVQTRTFADLDCNYRGNVSPCRMSVSFFLDPTEEFREWVKRL